MLAHLAFLWLVTCATANGFYGVRPASTYQGIQGPRVLVDSDKVRSHQTQAAQARQTVGWFNSRSCLSCASAATTEELKAERPEERPQPTKRVPFNLEMAVLLASFAFESYKDPGYAQWEATRNGTHMSFHSEDFVAEVFPGLLTVNLLRAVGLPQEAQASEAMYTGADIDPYVTVRLDDGGLISTTQTSAVRPHSRTPMWGELFLMHVHDPDTARLELSLYDRDVFRSDDLIAFSTVDLKELMPNMGPTQDDSWTGWIDMDMAIPPAGDDASERSEGNNKSGGGGLSDLMLAVAVGGEQHWEGRVRVQLDLRFSPMRRYVDPRGENDTAGLPLWGVGVGRPSGNEDDGKEAFSEEHGRKPKGQQDREEAGAGAGAGQLKERGDVKEAGRGEDGLPDWAVLTSVAGGLATEGSAFRLLCFMDNEETDTQAAVWRDSEKKRLLVSYRGTEQDSWKDLLTDVSVFQVPLEGEALNPEEDQREQVLKRREERRVKPLAEMYEEQIQSIAASLTETLDRIPVGLKEAVAGRGPERDTKQPVAPQGDRLGADKPPSDSSLGGNAQAGKESGAPNTKGQRGKNGKGGGWNWKTALDSVLPGGDKEGASPGGAHGGEQGGGTGEGGGTTGLELSSLPSLGGGGQRGGEGIGGLLDTLGELQKYAEMKAKELSQVQLYMNITMNDPAKGGLALDVTFGPEGKGQLLEGVTEELANITAVRDTLERVAELQRTIKDGPAFKDLGSTAQKVLTEQGQALLEQMTLETLQGVEKAMSLGETETMPKVHAGFRRAWQSIRGALNTVVYCATDGKPEDWHILMTGHSLGGALATLTTLDLVREYPGVQITMYNFGSPRVGNRAFVDLYDSLVGDSFRVVNDLDVVARLPRGRRASRVIDYEHAGCTVMVDEKASATLWVEGESEGMCPLEEGDPVKSLTRGGGGLNTFFDAEVKLLKALWNGQAVDHHMEPNYYASIGSVLLPGVPEKDLISRDDGGSPNGGGTATV